ncbi:hypothetical protein ACFU96_10130 [Streptomyces sp. NPDC057620]|uniref:hypothetical protein n=1 Tax=Streptomyces sp. NPDC057620 TaxID=3346185 RepID=UPI0036AE0E9F
MSLGQVPRRLELSVRCGERGFKASDFSSPTASVGFVDPGLKVGDDLFHSVLLFGVWPKGGATNARVFMDACRVVVPGADAERDLAELEVGDELVPLLRGEVAVFLARPELPAAGDVAEEARRLWKQARYEEVRMARGGRGLSVPRPELIRDFVDLSAAL